MSFLKQMLSPFVEFKDQAKKEPVREDNPHVAAPANPVQPGYAADHPLVTGIDFSVQSPVQHEGNRILIPALPEHKQYFEKLIEEANANNPFFAGIDFKEFIDGKMDIDNIADEETKYKTAFNVLKRSGITKERLLQTAQEYLNIIGRDMNAFQSAHTQNYQKDMRQKEQLLQKKAEEVIALSEKLNTLKKEISQLSQNMAETKEETNRTKNSFLLAGENKQQEIQTEIQKIQRYF